MTEPTAKGYTAPTVEEMKAAQRLINSHFHNKDTARVSIPANPADDDLIVMDFIRQTPDLKAAPDSEDEAFRKWWIHAMKLGWTSIEYNAALAAWNARARLDALEERETSLVRINIDLNDKIAELEREIREACVFTLLYENVRAGRSKLFPDFDLITKWLERNAERKNG